MNRIKEVLEERGIKQTWLAEKLGKSFCMVNSYVCNRRQPSLEVLFELCWSEICSEDSEKLFLITRGNEIYQRSIYIPKLHYFAWLCSQVINNHKLVTHHVSPIVVVPFAPQC